MSFSTTQLVGFGGRRSSSIPSVTYVSSSSETVAGATHTHETMSFGATGTNRVLICAVATYLPSGTLSSATIGGTSARICVQATGTNTCAAIISAAVASGTSGDVVLTWSNASTQYSTCDLYRVVDLTSGTEVTSGTDTTFSSGVVSTTLNNNANAIIIASGASIDAVTTNWTAWSSGLTEGSDQYIGTAMNGGSAYGFFATANTPYTATATNTSTTRGAFVVATWNN